MNKLLAHWLAGLVFLGFSVFNASGDLEVSASIQIHARAEFDAPLAVHGTWVEVGSYGRCWRPAHVVVGWRPYCTGEWVWTDCGWYWASDEPWGWACYHYGSWAYEPAFGWVWVPGVEWAPAWVSWRVGGGYIGWAPLPPRGWVFSSRPDPGHFVFVGTASFGGPVRSSALISKDNRVFAKTTEMGGVKRETRNLGGSGSQKVMVNNGPAPATIQKASGRNFAAVSIHDAVHRTPGPKQATLASKQSAPAREEKVVHNRPDKSSDRNSDRNSDRPDSRGQDNARSSSDRPEKSGFDRPSPESRDRGGHSGGGGRGRH